MALGDHERVAPRRWPASSGRVGGRRPGRDGGRRTRCPARPRGPDGCPVADRASRLGTHRRAHAARCAGRTRTAGRRRSRTGRCATSPSGSATRSTRAARGGDVPSGRRAAEPARSRAPFSVEPQARVSSRRRPLTPGRYDQRHLDHLRSGLRTSRPTTVTSSPSSQLDARRRGRGRRRGPGRAGPCPPGRPRPNGAPSATSPPRPDTTPAVIRPDGHHQVGRQPRRDDRAGSRRRPGRTGVADRHRHRRPGTRAPPGRPGPPGPTARAAA